MSDPAHTLAQAARALAHRLAQAGIDTAALDARLLVCAAAGLDHAGYIARERDTMAQEAAARLEHMALRRLAHEPVSRILGEREFWGLKLRVTPDVLDPRADTETLVEAVLRRLGPRCDEALTIIDLGTGSGAILAALLSECPRAYGVGLDRSEAAARVARDNLAALGLIARASVVVGDWMQPVGAAVDVIVSNPPYIASGELAGLAPDVLAYDPAQALDGGPDGLAPYRIIPSGAAARLKPGGLIALEIGWTQGRTVAKLLDSSGFSNIETVRDLGGRDRVVLGDSMGDSAPPK